MRKLALAVALLVFTGCVKKEVQTMPSMGVGPSLVIEQFMRAANGKDLEGMANLFGTKKGPVSKQWPKDEVEKRMFILAQELRHNDFNITGEQMVPGRTDVATRVMVQLVIESQKVNVPFTLVRYGKQGWLIEDIKLEALTAPKN